MRDGVEVDSMTTPATQDLPTPLMPFGDWSSYLCYISNFVSVTAALADLTTKTLSLSGMKNASRPFFFFF